MYDHKNRYRIQEYHKKPTFASFLPGLSGVHGIPVWCFYVNRGQCITSFGLEDKDRSRRYSLEKPVPLWKYLDRRKIKSH